jgi:diacylglycerol kinase family enzyme/membrane-associated phospholipid phosphatase
LKGYFSPSPHHESSVSGEVGQFPSICFHLDGDSLPQALPKELPGSRLLFGFLMTFMIGAAFGILTEVVFATSLSKELDAAVFLWIQQFRSPILTRLMILASWLGHPLVLALLAIGIGVFLASRRLYHLLAVELLIGIGGAALDLSLKMLFQRLRPNGMIPLISARGFSYPSGHALSSVLFFGGLAYLFSIDIWHGRSPFLRRVAVVLCSVIAILPGISRVYLGVHYLTDVLGGWTAGLFWLGVCINFVKVWRRRIDHQRRDQIIRKWAPKTQEKASVPGLLHTVVLINAGAKILAEGENPEEMLEALAQLFRAEGLPAALWVTKGDQIGPSARLAVEQGAKTLVAAGGDGTVNAVIQAIAGSTVRLGVLPMGTLNHFAHDLKIPTEMEEAVRAIARGVPFRVDVGEVNGRLFINNASIGFYAHMVKKRDEIRERLGYRKWRALFKAGLFVFWRFPLISVEVESREERWKFRTPLLFIGNNEYPMTLFEMGQRAALDHGTLSIYAVRSETRLAFVLLSIRALLGRLEAARDFQFFLGRSLSVDASRRRLRIALDGEVTSMQPPLEFRIRAQAIQVMVPEAAGLDATGTEGKK